MVDFLSVVTIRFVFVTEHVKCTMRSYISVFFLLCLTIVTWETLAINFEALPAVTMDYKVKIDAGKEDCYYQFVSPGATFYVSFQVC